MTGKLGLKKYLRLGLAALGPFLACRASFSATFELQRPDGTTLTYYYDAPSVERFPILVLLQGSPCASGFPMYQMMAQALHPMGIATLSLEKRGLTAKSSACPEEYLEHNTPTDRVSDYLNVIALLRREETHWDHRLGWAGESEGGMVASLASPQVPETSAVLLLASAGGMSMADEMLLLEQKQMARAGSSPAEIENAQADMRSQFEKIFANPTSKLEWLSDGQYARNTYLWWSVALKTRALDSLIQLPSTVPVYLVQGTADIATPVESADLIEQKFRELGRNNLTYRRYEGLDHHFSDGQGNHDNSVIRDAQAWLIRALTNR